MSPIHPSKRRRIDTATHTLSQPFKSPFKTPLKPKPAAETNLLPSTSTPLKEPTTNTTLPLNESTTNLPSPSPATDPPPTPSKTPHRTPHKPPLPPSSPSKTYTTLLTHRTNLHASLKTARATLETSTQALKIESSNREAELEALVQKWKVASRAVTEEVYASARDRVNKMGGVGAMREREREKEKGGRGGWGWEGEGDGMKKGDGEGDDGVDERVEREDGTGFGGEGRDEDEDEGGRDGREERKQAKEEEEEVRDDEGYTMDMMLKTLNIDLDVIGYDKNLQRWVD